GCVRLGIGAVPSVGEDLVRLIEVDEILGRDVGDGDEDIGILSFCKHFGYMVEVSGS
ncbi:hypothetical protein KI387_010348, partial [Taxus chinensis]